MAKLIISSGADAGKEFVLGDSQVIGRLGRNAIPIRSDTTASGEHARVYRKGDQWMVVDLNSTNGTSVNGEPIQKAVLSPTDRLLVGSTWFEFALDPEDVIKKPAVRPRQTDDVPASGGIELRERKGEISERAIQYSEHAASGRGGRGRKAGGSNTTLAWMRADLAQTSGLFRMLVTAGVVAIALGLGYLAYRLVAP